MLPSTRVTRDALLESMHDAGRPQGRWLIGVELERHILDPAGLPAPYFGAWGIRWLLGRFQSQGWRASQEGPYPIALTRDGASITLEPGGQLELSGAPYRRLAPLAAEATRFARDVDAHLEGTPYRQVALGFTPYASVPAISWVPKGRYAVMREHLGRTGALAHHMMKGTAATQASYDFADEADARRKVQLATALAPLIVGMFANSPLSQGRPNGWRSFRGFIWTQTDPARTGMPNAAVNFSFEDWIDYLLDVPMMFTKSGGQWRPAEGMSFRQWMDQGADGRFPTWADWDLHTTSVFPEVRVKRQIEVRMADCVPQPLAIAFVALWQGLFYDRRALDAASVVAERLGRHGTREDRFLAACRGGLLGTLGGRRLASWAEPVVDAARAGLARLHPGDERWLDPLVQRVAAARCPADDVLDAWRADPRACAVRRAAAL